MQAVLIALLAVFFICSSADQFIRVKRGIADLSNIVVRQKREELVVPRACNKKCEKDLEDSIKNNTVYDGAGSPFSILQDNFNKEGIEAVCKEFKKHKSCFTKCNEPSHALGVYLIICEQKKQELIKHLPCFHKTKNDTEKTCEEKCGGPAVVGALATAGHGESTSDIKAMLDSMRPMCIFLNCAVNCASDAFIEKCPNDPTAGVFFRDIGMAGAQTALGELEALDAALGTKLLPNECVAIITPNAVVADHVESVSVSSTKSNICDKMTQEMNKKQMMVLDKTDKMLDMEIAKLKLEMKLIEKQMHNKP
uniref:Chondroitin proteoglycan 4 domain-containing protein n=1 Tax=Plectus sambesii TaxID=2011161 RepID=A0A914W4S1_9BILA